MTLTKTRLVVVALAAIAVVSLAVQPSRAAGEGQRVYELRTYYTHPGKLDELHARFSTHTNHLFVKHGMTLIGYWTPVDGDGNTLIYLLAHDSMEAATESWKAFSNDPVWREAYAASRENGPLVKQVERQYLDPTEYSPLR